MRKSIVTGLLFILSAAASAHPGGQDSSGGHTNRKTGEYHCHRESCQKDDSIEISDSQEGYVSLYNRADWPHWVDYDGDCQDARAELLIAESLEPVKFKRNKGCVVSWGKWHDPYTNSYFTKASDLDADHIVPLKHAHGHGGQSWTREKRRQFANDAENLLAVSASENRSKGAKSPDQWMPPAEDYWCEYLDQWRAIKKKYGLYETPPETNFINEHARKCQ